MNVSRRHCGWLSLALLLSIPVDSLVSAANAAAAASSTPRTQGVLLEAAQVSPRRLKPFVADGYNAGVLVLDERASLAKRQRAARQIQTSGLKLYYWIEVGRNSRLADAHPEWMASIQTHPEWRRFFPKFPQAATNQVVKTYPWVPVLYRETFDAHRERVAELLKDLPVAAGIFLNDLQGAPSACGCGNSFCRWTTDYGPIKTATRLPNNAAAEFVRAVHTLAPQSAVIPVWTTECAEHDAAKGAACDGVGCFNGRCWKDYSAQLMPVADISDRIGVLLPYQDFPPSISRTGANGSWQKYALNSFTDILPARGERSIALGRLITVLQGWNVSGAGRRQQIRQCEESGARDFILALTKIDQSWKPRLLDLSKSNPLSKD